MEPADELFNALRRVSGLRFDARGRMWTGSGEGSVQVEAPADGVLVFSESGTWRTVEGKEFQFNNVFRWTVIGLGRVRLEHLRFGPDHPVELFDLVPISGGWRTDQAHLCRADCYVAELRMEEAGVWVGWQVSGPKKDEAIEYVYGWVT